MRLTFPARIRDAGIGVVGILVWLAFPVLVVDFRDGWWYACIGRDMLQRGSVWGVVLKEAVFQGQVFQRPAWAYALWAAWASSLSPGIWLLMEVGVWGGITAWLLWRTGRILGMSGLRRGALLLGVGWGVLPMQWLRPQIVLVVAMVGVWGWVLERLRGGRPGYGTLFLLSWVASNFHGGTVLLGLSLLLGLGGWLPRGELLRALLVWGVGSALHPYAPEPWRTTLAFGLHPPAVTEWESLGVQLFRDGTLLTAFLWGLPVGVYGWAALRLRRSGPAEAFLIRITGLMYGLAWGMAARFTLWAILGTVLLAVRAFPALSSRGRGVLYTMAGVLAVGGLTRFPWVEDRVQIRSLQQIPPPRELTWGMGRTAHVLCWAWPETPVFHTGLDALHPPLTEALRGGVRWVVTHRKENPDAPVWLLRVGARVHTRRPPYTLWQVPPADSLP